MSGIVVLKKQKIILEEKKQKESVRGYCSGDEKKTKNRAEGSGS